MGFSYFVCDVGDAERGETDKARAAFHFLFEAENYAQRNSERLRSPLTVVHGALGSMGKTFYKGHKL